MDHAEAFFQLLSARSGSAPLAHINLLRVGVVPRLPLTIVSKSDVGSELSSSMVVHSRRWKTGSRGGAEGQTHEDPFIHGGDDATTGPVGNGPSPSASGPT